MPNLKSNKKKIMPQIKWGESYTSLFLGIVVVVVLVALILSFVKGYNQSGSMDTSSTTTGGLVEKPTSYVAKEGDNLWQIAEEMYGSGYNWVDIASVNSIANPDLLYVGTKLTIPDVKQIVLEDSPDLLESIGGDTYTVKEGDNLWTISLRAYGDGYKWVELAKANNLANPDIIHIGDVIQITR